MIRKIPCYGNTRDDTRCWQACLKMILKYFYPAESFTYRELDRATNHVVGKGTWPFAGLMWLKRKGLEVRYFSDYDLKAFSKYGERYLEKILGGEGYENVIETTFDMNEEMLLAKRVIGDRIFTRRRVSFGLIDRLMEEGYVIIAWLDLNVLNGERGVMGHYVVLLGTDAKHVYFNDPGLPRITSRRATKKAFAKAAGMSKLSWGGIYCFRTKGHSRNRKVRLSACHTC